MNDKDTHEANLITATFLNKADETLKAIMMKVTVRLKTDSEHLGLDSKKRPKTVRLRVKLCELRGLDQVTSYVYSHTFRLCK